MAVPVDFQLSKEVDAAYGLKFVDDLARSLKLSSDRLDLDGRQFDNSKTVSDLTIYVNHKQDTPQACGAFLHALSVEFRQFRDEKSGPLANGLFDDLVGIQISPYCVPGHLASSNAISQPPPSKPKADSQPVRVNTSVFKALDLPLSSEEKSMVKKSEPNPAMHAKSHSYPNVSKPSSALPSVSELAPSKPNDMVQNKPHAAAGGLNVSSFVKFFEGLGRKK